MHKSFLISHIVKNVIESMRGIKAMHQLLIRSAILLICFFESGCYRIKLNPSALIAERELQESSLPTDSKEFCLLIGRFGPNSPVTKNYLGECLENKQIYCPQFSFPAGKLDWGIAVYAKAP